MNCKDKDCLLSTCGDEIGIDLLLLSDLVEKTKCLHDRFSDDSVYIELPRGGIIAVSRPSEDSDMAFIDRIKIIVGDCRSLSENQNVDYEFIVARILVIDGWTWNESVFRSPIWMDDHRDVPIDEAREIEGLQWLKGSSGEIKFGQK